jgi:uncharacterized protein with HEPN domain
MRERARIHLLQLRDAAYVDVNLQTVWSTVTRMLPRLVQQIESITG